MVISRSGLFVKLTVTPAATRSFSIYNFLSLPTPVKIVITPNAFLLVHRGKKALHLKGSSDSGRRVFVVALPIYSYNILVYESDDAEVRTTMENLRWG